MPIRISVSKEELKGKPPIPEGLYEVRLDKFEPSFSKNKDSVNLNPVFVVVNHPQHNGYDAIYENLNTRAGWIIQAFCHAFGLPMEDKGDNVDIPGEFVGEEADPSKWVYQGPLTGRTAKVYIKPVDNTRGRIVSKIDQYICVVPGCPEKHPNNLAR